MTAFGTAYPSVSVDYGMEYKYAGVQKRRPEKDRHDEIGKARAACPHCGGRAETAQGHPPDESGLPACLNVKGVRLW